MTQLAEVVLPVTDPSSFEAGADNTFMPDTEVVAACGALTASEALSDLAQLPVFTPIIRSVAYNSGHDAGDLGQEVLLRAAMQGERGNLIVGAKAGGWIRRVAKNYVIDEARKAARRPQETSLEVVNPPSVTENRFEATETRIVLDAILSRLSTGHRRVLETVISEDLTTAQAADVLHIPHGTVKSRLHHALNHAREIAAELGITHDIFA